MNTPHRSANKRFFNTHLPRNPNQSTSRTVEKTGAVCEDPAPGPDEKQVDVK